MNKLKESVEYMFNNSPYLKDSEDKEPNIDRVYNILMNKCPIKEGDPFTNMLIQSLFMGSSAINNSIFEAYSSKPLTEEEKAHLEKLSTLKYNISEVLKFLNELEPETSKDFYSYKYPEIYRHIYWVKDILIDALEEENLNIQEVIRHINEGKNM